VAHIARKGASHGLGFLVGRLDLRRHLPGWLRIPGEGKGAQPEELAARFAAVLEELGPTFVKFGQMLATRPDILPAEYIRELERITHHVAPFSGQVSRSIIAQELGQPAEKLFAEFTDTPRASGSIAQVHDAVLADGTAVVVKVRRPRIERIIEDDVAILTFLAAQADRAEEFRPLRLPMLVEEFGRCIQSELDFLAEAAYTHKFRESFRDDERIEIPAVYWDYTTQRVLTMQRVEGIHLGQLLRGQGDQSYDRSQLAHTVMDVYLRQFFWLGVFHGDPHPGNILLTESGRVALLDFGLVGRVSSRLRRRLGTCLIALGNGQYELAAEVMAEMGQVPSDAQAEMLQDEIVSLLDRNSSVPLGKLDVQRSFLEVMAVIRKHGVQIPRDLVLLGRALVIISGIVLQLDPKLNVGALAVPYGSKLLRQKASLAGVREALTAGGYHLGTLAAEGPRDVRSVVRRLSRGLFEFTVRHEGFEKGLRELDQTGNRLSLSVILAAIIIASSTLLSAGIGAISLFGWRVSLLGLIGLAFGLVLGVWLIVGILRSRRLL
jgi:ubiquinone biosynthesis protein